MTDLRVFTYESTELPTLRMKVLCDNAARGFVTNDGNGNFPPNQAITIDLFAHCNPRRTGNGIHVRGIMINFTDEPPEGYSVGSKLFIPVFRLRTYQQLKLGERGTFMGQPVIISSKRPEVIRS